jgi:hypothetical protein
VILGIDVGFSSRRPSTGLCVIAPHAAHPVRCAHVRAEEATAAVRSLVDGEALRAVGIDGPIRPNLTLTRAGRACERRLLRAPFHRYCKPGSTAAPLGQRLHAEATRLARDIRAAHPRARLVEAFPTAFLRTMLDAEACGDVPRGRKSQVYWERCVGGGILRRVIGSLYRGAAARIAGPLVRLTHRDERAAAICALTACAAALEVATAVGDAEDGWIWLPPRGFLADWARRAL